MPQNRLRRPFATLVAGLFILAGAANGTVLADTVSLCAEANDNTDRIGALVPDFTKQSNLDVRIIRWSPSIFERNIRTQLLERRHRCDLVILPAHMLGWAVTHSLILELTALAELGEIDRSAYLPAVIQGTSVWPKSSQNLWAMPADIDSVVFVYRRDWFDRADLRNAFRQSSLRDLSPPSTWREFRDVMAFFDRRMIDGRRVEGVRLLADTDRVGLSASAISLMLSEGITFDDPLATGDRLSEASAIEALERYRDIALCCRAPNKEELAGARDLNAFASGQIAVMLAPISRLRELVAATGGERIGFFSIPRGQVNSGLLDGRVLAVVAGTAQTHSAIRFVKWFSSASVQAALWRRGGLSAHLSLFQDEALMRSHPYGPVYLEALASSRNFWQEPAAPEMKAALEELLSDFLFGSSPSASALLSELAKTWTAQAGRLDPESAGVPDPLPRQRRSLRNPDLLQ